MVAYEEFTDRVEILRELDMWVKNIQRMAAPSTAIIAPRRMGKTVLLDRLVNTVFFKPGNIKSMSMVFSRDTSSVGCASANIRRLKWGSDRFKNWSRRRKH